MKISEIKEILKGRMLCGEDQMDAVVVAGGAADLMDDVLAAAAKGCVLLTGVTTDHVIPHVKNCRCRDHRHRQGQKPAQGIRRDGQVFRNSTDGDRVFVSLWPAGDYT